MSRFSKWASRGSRVPPPAKPQVVEGAVTLYTADGRPVHLSSSPVSQPQGQPVAPVHRPHEPSGHPGQIRPPRTMHESECMLVKPGDADCWTRQLNQMRDLTAEGMVPDLSEGYNALRSPGIPDGAVMAKWGPTARYYNGTCDMQSRSDPVDRRLSTKYSESSSGIRNSRATVKHNETIY